MTEQHRARPEVWAAVERWCKNDLETLNCILELRDRVEALEAALRPELQNLSKGTRLLSYRVENSALPIEEWGKNHTAVNLPTHNAPESSDPLVGRVADAIKLQTSWAIVSDSLCEETRIAILAVADWLDQQELHIAATRLRQEAQ